MGKLMKVFLWLIGLVVILLIGVVIAVATINPNDHKDWIIHQVEEKTGRSLSLTGEITISFYPWLGLEANGLTLGNAAGFEGAPFVRMDYINVRIKTLALLQGQYEVDTVNIRGAEINLAKNKDGVSNWDDLVSQESGQEPSQEPSQDETAALPLAAIALGGVAVEDALLTWVDAHTDTRAEVRHLNINTGELKYAEPIDLTMRFQAVSNKPAIDAKVNLTGILNYDTDTQQYNLAPLEIESSLRGKNIPGGETTATLTTGILLNVDADTATISALKLDALGAKINAAVSATQVSTPAPKVALTLLADGKDLSAFFKVLEIEPLASQIAALADRSFSVKTKLNADIGRGDIDISTLQAALLGADINADVKARHIQSEKPSYSGKITAKGPDLPTLMRVLGQLQGKGSALSEYGKQLSKVKARAFSVDAAFDADLNSGDMTVSTLAIDTLGVSVRGGLNGKNLQDKNASISGDLKVKAEKITALLSAFKQPDLAQVLQSINFETRVSGNPNRVTLQPLQIHAILSAKDIPNSPVKVSLATSNTQLQLNSDTLALQSATVDKLTLSGLGMNLSANVNVKKMDTAAEFDGDIQIAQLNLRKLASQLKQELPVMADKSTLQKVAVSTRFSGKPKSLSLTDFKLLMDDTHLQGNVSAVEGEANTAYKFALNIDAIDLDRYFPPKAKPGPAAKQNKTANQKAAAPAPASAATTAVHDAIPVEVLRALNIAGDVKLAKLKVANVKLANIALGLDARQGIIKLTPVAADLYQGKYSGDITIDATKKPARLTINSTLKGISMKPLLDDAQGTASLQGSGDLSLALTAAGLNAPTIKRTLNGQGSVSVTKGLFIGVNVRKVLEQVEIMFESKRFGKIDKGMQTQFDSLTGNVQIKSGVIRNDDLLMVGNGFKVDGKGMLANLNDETWKYNLHVDVVAGEAERGQERYNIGGYTIPIKCRGKIQDQNCKPDIADIAKTVAKKVLIEKLLPKSKKNADGTQEKFDPAKELLKKIF